MPISFPHGHRILWACVTTSYICEIRALWQRSTSPCPILLYFHSFALHAAHRINNKNHPPASAWRGVKFFVFSSCRRLSIPPYSPRSGPELYFFRDAASQVQKPQHDQQPETTTIFFKTARHTQKLQFNFLYHPPFSRPKGVFLKGAFLLVVRNKRERIFHIGMSFALRTGQENNSYLLSPKESRHPRRAGFLFFMPPTILKGKPVP